jgi:hypothetical protein
MFGWLRRPAACASRRKRSSVPDCSSVGNAARLIDLIATARSIAMSKPR